MKSSRPRFQIRPVGDEPSPPARKDHGEASRYYPGAVAGNVSSLVKVSFNNGAGMSRLLTAAAYAKHNMPFGTKFDAPLLTDVEAYDVAGYMVGQKRPEKANLEKVYPIRLQKPIDSPYGPYADGFSAEQHRLGPFGPIRAKVKELAAESRTANAGGPDNGSQQFDGGR